MTLSTATLKQVNVSDLYKTIVGLTIVYNKQNLSATDYLNSSEANKEHLLKEIEAPIHSVYTLEEFKEFSNSI